MALVQLLLLTLLVIISSVQSAPFRYSPPVCRNHAGKEVDYFIVYKLPVIRTSTIPLVRQGTGYIYMDSSNPEFTLAANPITHPSSAVGRTLDQVYKKNRLYDFVHAFYNDQPPPGADTIGVTKPAHAKGALAFDASRGFWLISSVPRFPTKGGYQYPTNAWRYGQMMICVTFPAATFNEIAAQLIYDHVWIYNRNMPTSFGWTHPNVYSLFKGLSQRSHRNAVFSYKTSPTFGTNVKLAVSLSANPKQTGTELQTLRTHNSNFFPSIPFFCKREDLEGFSILDICRGE